MRKNTTAGFKTVYYPKSRLATFDVGRIGRKKHHVAGLVEVDVTDARRILRERIKSGEKIGIIDWLIRIIAVTIRENPFVHAQNGRGRSQVLFEDVDISLPLERRVDGAPAALFTDRLVKNMQKARELEVQANAGN